jgi:isoleucyl-tRNA synthetase
VIDKYGADALRLYLINSPVVRAETLRFKEEGVFGVVKDVFLPWYNAYRFLVQAAARYEAGIGHGGGNGGAEGGAGGAEEEEEEGGEQEEENGGAAEGQRRRVRVFEPASVDLSTEATNVLDVWVLAAARGLVSFVREEMAAYRLYTVVPELVRFVERLTNVYVRFNRTRLKGGKGEADARVALATLHSVLLTLSRAMAPFTPFLSELMYRNLVKALPEGSMPESVHFADFPEAKEAREGDRRIRASVDRMTKVVELGRVLRERRGAPLKRPLRRAVIVHPDAEFLDDVAGRLREYVLSELNVRELEACADPLRYCTLRAEPEWGALAARGFGRELPKVSAALKALSAEEVLALEQRIAAEESVEVAGVKLGKGDVRVIREFKAPESGGGEAAATAAAAEPAAEPAGGKKGGKKNAAAASAAPAQPPGHLDASGDGDVLVVLDFEPDAQLLRMGAAREAVNRFMRLRKAAGLVPTDSVELFWGVSGGGGAGGAEGGSIASLFSEGSEEMSYMRAALVVPLRPLPEGGAGASLPDGLVEVARDAAGGALELGAEAGLAGELTAVIAAKAGSALAERLAAAVKV